jgi:hypothetical protein
MSQENLLQKIKDQAKRDRALRSDRRFIEIMGFLVAKGFLQTNYEVPALPNKRFRIEDAIWAGVNVEPRILEVLPAAVLRLEKHFDLDPARHEELAEIVRELRNHSCSGPEFYGILFAKIKLWANLPLRDGRVKTLAEKKITKTFRLSPKAAATLANLARQKQCTETEILESKILRQ